MKNPINFGKIFIIFTQIFDKSTFLKIILFLTLFKLAIPLCLNHQKLPLYVLMRPTSTKLLPINPAPPVTIHFINYLYFNFFHKNCFLSGTNQLSPYLFFKYILGFEGELKLYP